MPNVAVEPLDVNEECPTCGADVMPSSVFPWHFEDEDCHAIRDPLIAPTVVSVAPGIRIYVDEVA